MWKIRQIQKMSWVAPPTSWPCYSGSRGKEKLKTRTKVKTSCLVTLTGLTREDVIRTLLAQKNVTGTKKIVLLREQEQRGLNGKFCIKLKRTINTGD